MAVNTDNFGFKKPDESDFYDVQDQNGNWDIADQELEKLNSPTFEDYTEDTSVPEAVTAIEALKSKSKIGMLLSNIKAAFKGACLIGHIVNNCVTDNPSLPLSAAQGKVLMDYYTKLYSDIDKICFYTITGTTDTYGQIHVASDIVSKIFSVFVECENETLSFALKSGNDILMIFAITNSSLTNDAIKHVSNAKVTVRIMYYKK